MTKARTLELVSSSLLEVRHLVLVMASERAVVSRLDGWGTAVVSVAASRVLVRQQQETVLDLGFLALGFALGVALEFALEFALS